jgi:BirA family biotin operon repressor/biotin-[acetyl-CoA-carboxylase] ligase
MHIIKLNAIGSTNTFLKDLVLTNRVENYTVVTAESQFGGRGQMGASWESEDGKNLIFSMFVKLDSFFLEDSVSLNYAVSLAVYKILKRYVSSNLYVKWPNDILSDSKKICGLLIENSISSNKIKHSIIGIGINVNQEVFSKKLKMVTSIKNIIGQQVDKDLLLKEITNQVKIEIENCVPVNFLKLKERYLSVLYRYLAPTMFQKSDGTIFLGKIVGVSTKGDLEIELDDASIHFFGLKEIKILR